MIDMIAFALFTVAGLFSNGQGVQIPDRQAHYETVQYSAPPVQVMETCLVNGVNYPVDYYYHIWGTNAAGVWVIIGGINLTPNGPVAIGFGRVYPALCQ
jgi:hypothetical protein